MPIAMDKYNNFETEDFVLDEFFLRWVLEQSPDDDLSWGTWLRAHPDQEKKIKQAKSIIDAIRFDRMTGIPVSEIDAFILQVRENDHGPERINLKHYFNWKWLAIAGSLILLLSVSSYFFIASKKDIPQSIAARDFLETRNTSLSPMLIHLQDGTSVILKPGSSFRYPKLFSQGFREVFLNGEAFFEVHKNPKQPFFIRSGEMMTRVLGTSFIVRAYLQEQNYKVVVNTGRVEVYTHQKVGLGPVKPGIVLFPNEQVTYQKSAAKLLKEKLQKPALLSKEVTTTSFSFKDAPLEEVFKVLKASYGIQIKYDEKIFSGCSITARLYDDNIYEKLTAICKAIDAGFKIENGNILITGKGCSQ